MAVFCGDCGAEAAANLRFCRSCGAQLENGGVEGLEKALQALKVEPSPSPTEALRLGHLMLASGMSAQAEEAFSLAVDSDPYVPAAHLALAVVHLQSSRPEKAKSCLLAAIETGNSGALCACARAYLAMLLLDEYDVAGADEELKQAEVEDPGSFLVLWKRGEYYFRLGMYLDAERALRAALRATAPNKASAMYAAKLFETAQERAKRSVTREPLLPKWGRTLRRRLDQAKAGGTTA